MHAFHPLIAATALVVLVLAPLAVGIAGWWRYRRVQEPVPPVGAAATLTSTLLCILAFNLTFLVQELGLVVPKALTPGLRPTLYHNNHDWQGDHPLAELFQGTGALAIALLALGAFLLLVRGPAIVSLRGRLLLFWFAFCGAFMALPQVVTGALAPRSDVGRAMDYFGWSPGVKTLLALVALAAVPPIAIGLARAALSLAPSAAHVATPRARTRFVVALVTLPALLAIVPILAYRVPREWVEVVMLPVIVVLVGIGWLQGAVWRLAPPSLPAAAPIGWRGWPLVAAVLLLLAFQLVLRPGIAFF